VHEWLEYTGTTAISRDYLELLSNGPGELARRPLSVAAFEIKLRAVASKRLPRVLISRAATPLGNGSVEARLLEKSDHGVFDFDDAIMLPSTSRLANMLVAAEVKAIRMVTSADQVVAGNEWLAEWASKHAKNVIVIPSCVDTGKYTAKSSFRLEGAPRMVWVGSQATEKYLESITPALEVVHRETRATLTVISSLQPSRLDSLPFVNRIQWSPQEQLKLSAFDLALSPLSPGVWENGKCGYKAIQYAASGLPIVGSPIGVNAVLLPKFGALSARNHDEWVSAIMDVLAATDGDRAESGKSARMAAECEFSFAAWQSTWLREVLGEESESLNQPDGLRIEPD
jgi:hypothetical protein